MHQLGKNKSSDAPDSIKGHLPVGDVAEPMSQSFFVIGKRIRAEVDEVVVPSRLPSSSVEEGCYPEGVLDLIVRS
jgi:hypothetical protein